VQIYARIYQQIENEVIMPEIPEIYSRAKEMDAALKGKEIISIEVIQPKCLNIPPEQLHAVLQNAQIINVTHHGKWIKIFTTSGWLLVNLGMGGELLLTDRSDLPEKYRLIIDFLDSTCLSINFWWFGYVYYAEKENLASIPMIAKLGPDILSVSLEEFQTKVVNANVKTRVKSFLLDQSRFAGIGNAYIHDILLLAGLHPERRLGTLSEVDIRCLFQAIQDGLYPSIRKGGAFYEVNLYGEKGGFQMEDILVGYKEGQPCPKCSTGILKLRTGSTNSYICPSCQPFPD
jgi:formamidopyrimidine-DNA glycosylase